MRYITPIIAADNLLLNAYHPLDGRWIVIDDVTATLRGIVAVAKSWRRAWRRVRSLSPTIGGAIGPRIYWFDGATYWATVP